VAAFWDDQLRATELPERIAVESAVMAAAGVFHALMFTLPDAEPPSPEHVIE
jgi:hypothetical protein